MLGDSLKVKPFLSKLGLESNNIGPDGTVVIANSLAGNSAIIELYLSGNGMKNEGLVAIAHILRNKFSLTILELESNLLSDGDGFEVL